MANEKVQFGDMKEPVNVRYIGEAGIYRDMKVKKLEFVPANAEKKLSAYLLEVFENPKGEVFENRYWAPPETEEEVKFVSKLYGEKGEELRDMTKAEQIRKSFETTAYHMIQLCMALGVKFDDAKSKITAHDNFKGMCTAFEGLWKLHIGASIDMKLLWNNSDKKKTSFLGIPDAGYRNVVFLPYKADKPNSELALSPYEIDKKLTRKYKPTAKAPADGAVESAAPGEGFVPVAAPEGSDGGDLF